MAHTALVAQVFVVYLIVSEDFTIYQKTIIIVNKETSNLAVLSVITASITNTVIDACNYRVDYRHG